MKTRITEMLGIEHPIILAAMAWISNAEMVAAISEAGGLGTIGPNAGARMVTRDVYETGERLKEQIKKVRALTDKPFAVNFVVGLAGRDKDYSQQWVEVGIEERVPVAIVSQGSPLVYTEKLKKAGVKVIHVCASIKHAKKAEDAGVDAVVASGTEGGGHSGFDQSTTFCLVPQVADVVKIPVIAGGGVSDGRQLISAIALGAEGVYVGTRFIATEECPAHDTFKKTILNSKDGDTIAIRHGMAAQNTDGNKGFAGERRGSLRIILNPRIKALMDEHSGMIDYDLLTESEVSVPKNEGGSATAASSIHGESERNYFAGGQGVGLINQIISCKELIQQIMKEADTAQQKITKL